MMTKTELLMKLDEILNRDAQTIDEQDLEEARRLVLDEMTKEASQQLDQGMKLATHLKRVYKGKRFSYPWNCKK